MIAVRTLTQAELTVSPEKPSSNAMLDDFRTSFDSVESRPEWCFVVEGKRRDKAGATICGYVGYRAPQSHGDSERTPDEIILFELILPWREDFLTVGSTLLRESLARLCEQGVRRVRFEFSSADFWDERERPNPLAQPWREVALHTGMILYQQKVSFRHDGPPDYPVPSRSLVFRSLAEIGQTAYIDAIKRVTEGTLDGIYRQDRLRLGPQSAAQHFFDSIADEMTYEPRLWKLAYSAKGLLIGLVAPLKMWEPLGTLGYVGVVPEQRGDGYVDELLREGNAALYAEGISRIVADTDSENFPMQRAFARAGYREQGRLWAFRTDIRKLLKRE